MIAKTIIDIPPTHIQPREVESRIILSADDYSDFVELSFFSYTIDLTPEKAYELGEALLMFAKRQANKPNRED